MEKGRGIGRKRRASLSLSGRTKEGKDENCPGVLM